MTREELEAKFHGNAALAIPGEQASRLIRIIAEMATQPHITGLTEALRS
jgi:hypothetical protein